MKHRAVVLGCGRIGTGYRWHDDSYTHMGAYRALADRVEVVGIADPDAERLNAATSKWGVQGGLTAGKTLEVARPDVVSICTQPDLELRQTILDYCEAFGAKAIWCEKPFVGKTAIPTQVNLMRRGDPRHQRIAASDNRNLTLRVIAKDDIHTRCHFEDLAKWWKVPLEYMAIKEGPCSYTLGRNVFEFEAFPNGGVDGGTCFRAMLGNLLDHIEGKAELWSPPQ